MCMGDMVTARRSARVSSVPMDIAAVEQSFGELLAALGDIVVARTRGAPADPAAWLDARARAPLPARRRRVRRSCSTESTSRRARSARTPGRSPTCAGRSTGSIDSSRRPAPTRTAGRAGAPPARHRPIARARAALYRRYGEAASSIRVGTETLDRLTVLARLGTEPDPAARRRLFEALAPVWRVVDGDGDDASPYRRLLRVERRTLAYRRLAGRGERRVALGPRAGSVRGRCSTTSWPPGGPCSGPAGSSPGTTATRSARRRGASMACVPADRLLALNRDYLRALGADPDALGHPVRRPATARASADPARVHAGHGRLGGRPAGRDGTLDAAAAMGLRDVRRRAASATSSSCSTRAAMRSTPRPSGPGRPSSTSTEADTAYLEGVGRRPRLGRRRAGLAASLAGRGRRPPRGRPRPLWRGDARHLLGAVRDRAPSPARPPTERRLDRDHGRRPGHRAAPRMVVVGDPRPAHRRARLHGQLRPVGDHRGRGPGPDPRGPRAVVGGRPGLVRVRGRRAVRRRRVARRRRTCSRPSSAGR